MERQRAEIVRQVDIIYGDVENIATSPQAEPIMQLEDGRQVPAFHCDRYTPQGTQGWAELDVERRIWKFTPDEPEIEPFMGLPGVPRFENTEELPLVDVEPIDE